MIAEFETLVTAHQLPREILQRIEQRLSKNGERKIELTALQKEVLKEQGFWADSTRSNIVIQGATSSGKTLLSEIAAISCLSHNHGQRSQVIVLVPLKAMVHERWKIFSGDLEEKRVFAASADYQDHDSDLVQGDYDVAIIVYEKFFALIAQYGSHLLDKCGLLIADEIQMLSTDGRGPKLEFSLQRVLEWYQDIRIMGLTTNHTKVNNLKKWMNVSYVLGNSKRPVALEEYIIATNGKGWKHVEHGDSGSADLPPANDIDNPIDAEIELDTKLSAQAPFAEHKNNLLVSLMRHIQRKDAGKFQKSKIIIFANSRNKTKSLAKLLCQSGLYERQELPKSLYEQVEKVDNDEFQMELLENMLPYGIAFHNSALPVSLRQVIENDFSDTDGAINIIVATETLTIGMNMPTDIMVLYDKTVYRGDHTEHELLPQEYKNFIGRAGRLGFDKAYGQSYSKGYRERTIEYRHAGHTLEETHQVFKVSRSTIQKWEKQLKETGDLGKKELHRSFRKIDPEKLKAYVAEHPDAYQSEMAEIFGCSEGGIRYALRQQKITRKKDNAVPGAGQGKGSSVSRTSQRHTARKDCLCG